jgi:hypothetical protein
MLRYAMLVAVIVTLGGAQALADEVGRYQIVTVPLGLEGEAETSVLLDTLTGRSWHAMIDDKGRPRWRGVEFAGGSQGIAQLPNGVHPEEASEEPQADSTGQ